MSWDISLTHDDSGFGPAADLLEEHGFADVAAYLRNGGQHAELDANYTYNVSGMYTLAMGDEWPGFNRWHGKPVSEVLPVMERGLVFMDNPSNHAALDELNPPNGWGNREGATEFLRRIVVACRASPFAKLYVC